MKKSILTILALLPLFCSAQKEVNGCIVTMTAPQNNNFVSDNDTLKVSFEPTSKFWNVKIENKLKKDISINWEKSSYIMNGQASKIVTGETVMLQRNIPLSPLEIPSGSFVSKEIFPLDNISPTFTQPTIQRAFVRQRYEATGNPDKIKIVFAISTGTEESKFTYNFEVIPKPKK